MFNEAETNDVLTKVRRTRNTSDRGEITSKSFRYMRVQEQQAAETELLNIENRLNEPEWVQSRITGEGRKSLVNRARILRRDLNELAVPTDLAGPAKNALYKRLLHLRDTIREDMPPHEIMRRNPAGAVDWHTRWQNKNKDAILEYKNIVHALNPGDTSKDIANIELIRPSMLQPGQSTFMADAQIPGHMAYTSVPDENWERTFGHLHNLNSPLETADGPSLDEITEARDRDDDGAVAVEGNAVSIIASEIKALGARMEALEKPKPRPKRVMPQEERERRNKILRDARAAKRVKTLNEAAELKARVTGGADVDSDVDDGADVPDSTE
ncbi:hypothetical protein CMI37_07280 [Candidatus Pacearchaeota archaeon]|nr:hypothetical protein [Candidatus Pacearchaeota archaeon]